MGGGPDRQRGDRGLEGDGEKPSTRAKENYSVEIH